MKTLLALGFVLALLSTAAAQTLDARPVLKGVTLDAAAATQKGLVKRKLDFGAPELDFSTWLPPEAKIETARMQERPVNSVLSLKIIGKITVPSAGGILEATIHGYRMTSSPSAWTLCNTALRYERLRVRSQSVTPDLTMAQFFSRKVVDEKIVDGYFSQCMTRGRSAMAIHVHFDAKPAGSAEEFRKLAGDAASFAARLFTNLSFANEAPTHFATALVPFEIQVAGKPLSIQIGDHWEVAFDDLTKREFGELYFLRRSSAGEIAGFVWLTVLDAANIETDLKTAGDRLLRQQFEAQSPDPTPPVLLGTFTDTTFAAADIPSVTFRYKVANEAGEHSGILQGIAARHDGRLYVVSAWSRGAKSDSLAGSLYRVSSETLVQRTITPLAARLKGAAR